MNKARRWKRRRSRGYQICNWCSKLGCWQWPYYSPSGRLFILHHPRGGTFSERIPVSQSYPRLRGVR